jgi:hypothetical protein
LGILLALVDVPVSYMNLHELDLSQSDGLGCHWDAIQSPCYEAQARRGRQKEVGSLLG